MSKNSHPVCTSKTLMSSDTVDKSSAHWKNICTFLNVWTAKVLNQWVPLLLNIDFRSLSENKFTLESLNFFFVAYQDRIDHHLPSIILLLFIIYLIFCVCVLELVSQCQVCVSPIFAFCVVQPSAEVRWDQRGQGDGAEKQTSVSHSSCGLYHRVCACLSAQRKAWKSCPVHAFRETGIHFDFRVFRFGTLRLLQTKWKPLVYEPTQ